MINFIDGFNFKDLFVLDLANNHQGDLQHALEIIKKCSDVVDKMDVKAGIKFQFRDLPSFVHESERDNSDNSHVSRFLSTMLSWSDFKVMKNAADEAGLITICTPFDEVSVQKIIDMKFDIIKVASCSATDWPLLEKIANAGLPIIASTGGLEFEHIDRLVSFLQHRGCNFALMHCVSIYPTPDYACNLRNIAGLKERYPNIVIGWSTHEAPEDTIHVGLAAALGAEMFERHVGLETEHITLNKYSSTPAQLTEWISSYKRARILLGSKERSAPLPQERDALDSLTRGVFANRELKVGERISRNDVTFAFPAKTGQVLTGMWSDNLIVKEPISNGAPVIAKKIKFPDITLESILKENIHHVKALLNKANISLNPQFTTEYSHHYGIKNFSKVGVVLINVINRDYAKKILVQLPGQQHPAHYHKVKEETFLVTWGTLIVTVEDKETIMRPGDVLTVYPGVWHSFKTDTGCVFEEISTKAINGDSVYRDPKINKLSVQERKTIVDHWGRFQMHNKLTNK
ncbi:N-acetylneuraminate synthase family protein [Roseobacter sp. HKCCD5988]|uniref:N-acetylneuraminate synthase family protein n=1 Tax=Roseobacter sp. HKCCD5988 TaxID=3120338 RepID=UPI0030EBB8AE